MLFNYNQIDLEKTRVAVESELEKYKVCLFRIEEDKLPKITQTFSLAPPSFSNEFHSSTEDAAIENIVNQQECLKHIEKIRRAVNRLSAQERQIIIKRYLTEEDEFDYQIYNEIGLSERSYYRIKQRAFTRLASLLKVEVFFSQQEEVS
ncbi:ArpU family transcriptional regulator [Alkalihalophilus pseudofirmus]|uniref:ArpU family phage packaging/lysis transcriptional regulator n=1 Tax=Alkalihalophilus pseudofirmus TaxID=79885 RepID=UPI000952144A|nr:ArpU family transcriptional regulator [Alkalihalophilus pseudofirmus]